MLTLAWPGCWGGMGRGRADGAGSECSVRTGSLPEYVSLVLQGRESWPPSARAENVEGPGLLELGSLVDCLCPRWWWELTFQLGWGSMLFLPLTLRLSDFSGHLEQVGFFWSLLVLYSRPKNLRVDKSS